MYAMILAAGKGERMLPLSLNTPKPLLQAAGKPLLQYHIEALAAAAFSNIVINTGRLGDQIESRFGRGECFGVTIHYSHEGDDPLGTGGGIRQALPLLGDCPFILVNGDVWTDFNYTDLPDQISGLAHLVLVDNPAHNPGGDFALSAGQLALTGLPMLTYSGIGVYKPGLFTSADRGLFSLVPLLKQAVQHNMVSGQRHAGRWFDIGTPERLSHLNKLLKQ
jgi:N-acetyl-alpha-D-muramate 1-phosphate uridylyltransferase